MSQTLPKNYYQLLELENFADLEQVKSAFRRLARQYHPDLNGGNKVHEERFKQINEAYDVLGSHEKKALYDDALRTRLKIMGRGNATKKESNGSAASATAHTTPKESSSSSAQASAKANADKAPPVNEFFESVRKAFAQDIPLNHGQPQPKAATKNKTSSAKRGQDVTVDTLITAQEAREGVIKTVNVQHQDVCKRCSGSGKVLGKTCTQCHGEKLIMRHKKIDVRIPAGVKSGSKVRVSAEGVRGENGGEAGDLFLLIQVSPESSKPDDHLRVEGLDVYGELSVAIPDAVLGATVDVPTIHGSLKLTIPPLSSSGRVLRLKEQGVHSGLIKGDHYVTLRLVAPENLSARERELYQELAQIYYSQRKPKG